MAKKKTAQAHTTGWLYGNYMISIGQAAVDFQQAADNRAAAKKVKRELLWAYSTETGEWFDEDNHNGEEDEQKILAAIANAKAVSKLVPAARAKMVRAIKAYKASFAAPAPEGEQQP